jgi:hypothetical protein
MALGAALPIARVRVAFAEFDHRNAPPSPMSQWQAVQMNDDQAQSGSAARGTPEDLATRIPPSDIDALSAWLAGTRLLSRARRALEPCSIVVDAVDPCAYDGRIDAWVQPWPMPESATLVTVAFTVTNAGARPLHDVLARAHLNGANLMFHAAERRLGDLGPGESKTVRCWTYGFSPRPPGQLMVECYTAEEMHGVRAAGPYSWTATTTLGEATIDYAVYASEQDTDQDGINDADEARLLARFRPYFKFTGIGDSDYKPVDVLSYIRGCRLITTEYIPPWAAAVGLITPETVVPETVITENAPLAAHPISIVEANGTPGSSNVTCTKAKTYFALDPLDPSPTGATWQQILSSRRVGLYGHVVPFRQAGPQGEFHRYADPHDETSYIKIEYWLFAAYNEDHAGPVAQHQGDWMTVQLLVRPHAVDGEDEIVYVLHYAHGQEIRYTVAATTARVAWPEPPHAGPSSSRFQEWRGPGYGDEWKHPVLDLHLDGTPLQNSVLRMCEDPDTGEFTHPVVYVERDSHEFWPTHAGYWPGAPGHEGDGYSFLSSTPPNLGEVEHPMIETDAAPEILQFNGTWGARGGGGPPHGPPLHKEWVWPEDSSVRWLLTDLEDSDTS